jgi:beta-N-acetylhexosaminidase
MEIELVPFIRAIERGMDGIMTAHIAYPEILHDSTPATLSSYFLNELLRKKLGFEGIIMTDDMEMHAISKNYDIGEAAVKAVQAGADIILISSYGNNLKKIRNALRDAVKRGDITMERLDASVGRIIELKLRYKIMEVSNGKIVRKNHPLSKEDLEMLEHAESVNRKISRMAIYAHGFDEKDDIFKEKKRPLYVITDNAYLKAGIATLCGERARFIDSSEISTIPVPEIKTEEEKNKKKKKQEDKNESQVPMVLFHVHEPNESAVRQVAKLCSDRNLRLCVLSTGNPFPLAAMEDLPPTVFTFSTTKASLDELAECISGSFEPKERSILISVFRPQKSDLRRIHPYPFLPGEVRVLCFLFNSVCGY